jgi:hypothetical protein
MNELQREGKFRIHEQAEDEISMRRRHMSLRFVGRISFEHGRDVDVTLRHSVTH